MPYLNLNMPFPIKSGEPHTSKVISAVLSRLTVNQTVAPVFLCIGSDRVTGDCLGPLVGTLLTERFGLNCFVYGTLNRAVTARTVESTLAFIRSTHRLSKIVAIDAALGQKSDVGLIKLNNQGIYPALAMGKRLALTGDYSIIGVVNESQNASVLSATRLGIVWRMAEEIASGIAHCHHFDSIPLNYALLES